MTTYLITGASGGLGLQLADLYAQQQGVTLIMSARDQARLQGAAECLRTLYPQTRVHVCAQDLAVPEGPALLMAQVEALGVHIDVLLNLAGMGHYGDFAREIEMPQMHEALMVNTYAPMALAKAVLPGMIERQRGQILFTTAAPDVPTADFLSHAASKAALRTFALGLHEELKDTPIHICTLAPMPSDTGLYRRATMRDAARRMLNLHDPVVAVAAAYEALQNGMTSANASSPNGEVVLLASPAAASAWQAA